MSSPAITLTTDFGYRDPFVGIMKGVILKINPDAVVVDLSHDVSPHDVRGGAFTLFSGYRYFPKNTIHVAVVDPGVGTSRRPIAVKTKSHIFVGPDNGLLSWAMADDAPFSAREISNRDFMLEDVSSTFHGRDIFAPAAARLSLASGDVLGSGMWDSLGGEVDDPVVIPFPEPRAAGSEIVGEVIHVDRFGNLITNIPSIGDMKRIEVSIRGRRIEVESLSKTYGEVKPGGLLILRGSAGFLEIALRDGSAVSETGAEIGDEVLITLK